VCVCVCVYEREREREREIFTQYIRLFVKDSALIYIILII